MALQPIDLQNMYAQMSNVAQNVAMAQDAPRMAEAMNARENIRRSMEKAQTVQKTSNESGKASLVKDEGGGTGGGGVAGGKRKDASAQEAAKPPESEIVTPAYLGQRVNIVIGE